MAGTLKTQFGDLVADTWTQVAGEGIRSLSATDEYSASVTVQNASGDEATVRFALVRGTSAPAGDGPAGTMVFTLAEAETLTRSRLACEAGVTIWIKSTAANAYTAEAAFAATA